MDVPRESEVGGEEYGEEGRVGERGVEAGSYAERVVGGKREEEDDWFGGLVFHGNVYISFVLFYHLYVHGIGKGDIEWRRLPGYCEISATVPMLVMECRFQVGEVMM